MDTSARPELRELADDECWEHLAGGSLGRIAWTGPDGPTVVPVNYGVADGALWVRTSAYGALAREADESPVAFEVDQVDGGTHVGWSVQVRGTAHVRFPGDDGDAPPEVEVWPAGPRPLWVVIEPREVTGRRLEPPA